jgi:hypothetical protein
VLSNGPKTSNCRAIREAALRACLAALDAPIVTLRTVARLTKIISTLTWEIENNRQHGRTSQMNGDYACWTRARLIQLLDKYVERTATADELAVCRRRARLCHRNRERRTPRRHRGTLSAQPAARDVRELHRGTQLRQTARGGSAANPRSGANACSWTQWPTSRCSAPDSQLLGNEWERYNAVFDEMEPLSIGRLSFVREPVKLPDGTEFQRPPYVEAEACVLSLENKWFACRLTSRGRSLWVEKAKQPLVGGMSDSPIISDDKVIGVFCTSGGPEGSPRGGTQSISSCQFARVAHPRNIEIAPRILKTAIEQSALNL